VEGRRCASRLSMVSSRIDDVPLYYADPDQNMFRVGRLTISEHLGPIGAECEMRVCATQKIFGPRSRLGAFCDPVSFCLLIKGGAKRREIQTPRLRQGTGLLYLRRAHSLHLIFSAWVEGVLFSRNMEKFHDNGY